MIFKLLNKRWVPVVAIDIFNGNPLSYAYFMALFKELDESRIDDPHECLTRLIKDMKGEVRELVIIVYISKLKKATNVQGCY